MIRCGGLSVHLKLGKTIIQCGRARQGGGSCGHSEVDFALYISPFYSLKLGSICKIINVSETNGFIFISRLLSPTFVLTARDKRRYTSFEHDLSALILF